MFATISRCNIVLLIAKDTIENYAIILFTIVLGTIAGGIIKAILSYTFTVFNSIIILIISKILYNIITIIK